MRIVVVGLGSIGTRHLGNIRALEPSAEILVLRHSANAEKPAAADRMSHELEQALDFRPDVAFVCGPTTHHCDIATAFAAAGAHLFVEKPLAANATDARRIVEAADRHNRRLIVGYNLRFLRSLQSMKCALDQGDIGRPMFVRAEVGQYLPDWRPGTDYRLGNTARAELGGGIEFELSHEFDYVQWLLGPARSATAMFAKLSDLDIACEDTAEVLVKFESGAMGSVHLDMTQRSTTRICKVAGTDGTLVWDAVRGTTDRYRPGEGWRQLVEPDGDRNEMYQHEVRHVLACIRDAEPTVISGTDGLRAVVLAEAARLSSSSGKSQLLST